MTIIEFNPLKHTYDQSTKAFFVPGKTVKFDSTYKIVNTKTGGSKEFDFKTSTGSEWDPKTIWIYKTSDGEFTLNVGNEDVTPAQAKAYLDHKIGRKS